MERDSIACCRTGPRGDADDLNSLGFCFEHGIGVDQDIGEARRLNGIIRKRKGIIVAAIAFW
jgi:hypothetical protein